MSDSSVPRGTFSDQVQSWGTGVVESYLETRGRNDNARSVKSLIEETAREYGGRFFVELLQNAHDAHPAGSLGGRVLMVLDEAEGPHGTVYAADAGTGFTHPNFRAISNLALSSKPVGEGIGNKGIGFKSVLQVCESPEVYSCDPEHPARDGFCFRFAGLGDFRTLTRSDEEFEYVRQDVSRYTVPVPVHDVPPQVRELRDDGFRTVFRLPLRSGIAKAEAAKRFEELGAGDVPVVIFLTRITGVTLVRRSASGSSTQVLERHSSQVALPAEAPDAELVTVGDGREFLVFSRDIASPRLRAALEEAVRAERLKEKWLEWDAPAHVSVAVPHGWSEDECRLYTYLPMGEDAHSPFHGHLHAPFFTDFSRQGMAWDHPLNRMLLDTAAELAVDAAGSLVAARPADLGLSPEPIADAAVDLLSWQPGRTGHLPSDTAARRALPGLGGGAVSIRDAWTWPDEAWDVLTAELASSSAGLHLLATGVSEDRLEGLRATAAALDESVDLSPSQLAAAVEVMAATCLADGLALPMWDLLYDDLAVMFDGDDDAKSLAGRRLLLADDGTLRECSAAADQAGADDDIAHPTGKGKGKGTGSGRRRRSGAAAPFFPPVRLRTDDEDDVDPDVDLELPPALKDRLFFLHPGLAWHDETRQTTRAREFLLSNRFVRKFDARSLAEHIRSVLAETGGAKVHREAMRFLFNLQRSRPSTNLSLEDSNLRVPSAAGPWLPASDAVFSRNWPGTRGPDLHAVASVPAETSPELAVLSERLLADPESLLKPGDDRTAWVQFLERVGVANVLPVQRARDARALNGNRLRGQVLAAAPGLPEGIAVSWAAALPPRSDAYNPETPYKCSGHIAWLPGQDAFDDLPATVRAAYARLLLAGLDAWSDDVMAVVWERDRAGYKDPQTLPTPLGAFVRDGRWLPVHDPATKADSPAAPQEAWHFQAGTDSEPPRFAPIVARQTRALLDVCPTAVRRLRAAGMGVWNSPSDAPRLATHLARLYAEGHVDEAFSPRLANAYRAAWATALEQPTANGPGPEDFLLVRAGGGLRAVQVSDIGELNPVVVTDESDDPFLRRIGADFELQLLHLDAAADRAAERIAAQAKAGVLRPTDLRVQVQLDGVDFTPRDDRPGFSQVLPWLRDLLTLVVAHRLPVHERPGETRLRQFVDGVAQLRLATARRVAVTLAEQVRPVPAQMRGVMPVPHPEFPTLVIELDETGDLGWRHMDAAAEPMMQMLGYPSLATEVKLALSRLRSVAAHPEDDIAWPDLAEALEVEREAAQQTLAGVGSGVRATLERLHPIVGFLWGAGAAAPFGQSGSIARDDALESALLAAASANAMPAGWARDLLDAARAADDVDALRRHLEIPLEGFNAFAATQDPPHPPIDYGPVHEESFELAVLAHADELYDGLRWAFVEFYRQTTPVPGWAEVKDLRSLRPDPGWALTRESVGDVELVSCARQQLSERIGRPLPASGPPLEPLTKVRTKNKPAAEAVMWSVLPVTRAWCRKHGVAVPAALGDASDVRPALDLLDSAGALDFDALERSDVLDWARAGGVWPPGMPLTTELSELGLTPEDLDAEKTEEEVARERRQQERRLVEVEGTAVDIGAGFAALRELLQASLDSSPEFLRAPARNTRLDEAPPTGGRRSGERPTGGAGAGAGRASDVQLNAIGFAGEWLAYQWLLAHYPGQVDESCWKSRNRAEAFTGGLGDDGLGYDFLVPFRGGAVMYEVKATTGDGGEFQLGESEVLAAQANSRNNRWRLLVVTQVLTSDRGLRQLRNPFHPDSRGEYTFAGQGLRLLYRASA
jgi:hypothetical protein